MKTAKQKAKEWVHENVVLSNDCGFDYTDVEQALELLLKLQDRDTRHACAEAMLSIEELPDGGGISRAAAHMACINVKAV